jgi:hypothetical protein
VTVAIRRRITNFDDAKENLRTSTVRPRLSNSTIGIHDSKRAIDCDNSDSWKLLRSTRERRCIEPVAAGWQYDPGLYQCWRGCDREASSIVTAGGAAGDQILDTPIASDSRPMAGRTTRKCSNAWGHLRWAAARPSNRQLKVFVESGGLISYGSDQLDHGRGVAHITDQILKGTKPVDVPVFQPTSYELAFNLKTAKALDLKLPTELLAVTDEVIE